MATPKMATSRGLNAIVSDYVLSRELSQNTIDHYYRCESYIRSWHGGDISEAEFTADLISRFLLAKQQQGCSSFYRQSLRNALVAFLHFSGKSGKVRTVKLDELDPQSWSPEEVARLIEATDKLRGNRPFWRTIIPAGYYSGLTQIDLVRVDRGWIDAGGILRTRRTKTGKRVVARLPSWLVAELPAEGLCWPWKTSDENFRLIFGRIVKWAGLTGSFKKLRKSAGTEAERLHPGQGHLLLSNSRLVFERHYLASTNLDPIGPGQIPIDRPPTPPRAA